MQLGWWGIATYLSSLVKTDPTDRTAARMLVLFLCSAVAFLIGATLGDWVAGIAVLAILIVVLLAIARRAQPRA